MSTHLDRPQGQRNTPSPEIAVGGLPTYALDNTPVPVGVQGRYRTYLCSRLALVSTFPTWLKIKRRAVGDD